MSVACQSCACIVGVCLDSNDCLVCSWVFLVNHSGYAWLPLSTIVNPLADVHFPFWLREVTHTIRGQPITLFRHVVAQHVWSNICQTVNSDGQRKLGISQFYENAREGLCTNPCAVGELRRRGAMKYHTLVSPRLNALLKPDMFIVYELQTYYNPSSISNKSNLLCW